MANGSNRSRRSTGPRILTLFGTRPEAIKLAPVVHALAARPDRLDTITVSSAQHTDLVRPFTDAFEITIDVDLEVGAADQTPADVFSAVLARLDAVLERERPDAVLVQGDTTTAAAGALAAFYRKIPVGHVEAGLRSGDPLSPFPEEMNRRVITRLASLHFAATTRNVATLKAEGIDETSIALTGNPVVDAVAWAVENTTASSRVTEILTAAASERLVVLTTHRRESFGEVMTDRLRALGRFVEAHDDVALVFPVHPNPEVRRAVEAALAGTDGVHLVDPLGYLDFVHLLAHAWLVVSDSGGIQEEAPSLGKPVLVIRENTERPEAIEAGVARLVGRSAAELERLLEECYVDPGWTEQVKVIANPFGERGAGERIVDALERFLER